MGVLVAATGGFLNVAEATPISEWVMPAWGWFTLAMLGLAIAPFLAFHRMRVAHDELLAQRPSVSVVSNPEDNYVRLRVKNLGGYGRFWATGHIAEHESGTPWPIQWRNTYEEAQESPKGSTRWLNIASLEQPGMGTGESVPYIRFHTAQQPHRKEGIMEGMLSRNEFKLPSELRGRPTYTIRVEINSEPPLEVKYSTNWVLAHSPDCISLVPGPDTTEPQIGVAS
ncbi:hypothetical protein LCGC14_1505020 [marine sediment metagenome]|uniref:Uncharacterized protein n=1 Tax=marine sediment metagenome TaxID=412755 RepID=A0A0F9JNR3_9ZZZZ